MTGSPLAFGPEPTGDGSEVSMCQGVEILDCATLDEFWDLVSPIGEHFGQHPSKFIFRGQRDSEWKLVPKIFRPHVIDEFRVMAGVSDHPGQFIFEWSLLNGFIRHCDDRGLAVPGDSMEFRKYFEWIPKVYGINTLSWPEERVVPLMALAQHHGLPTRLLDWSNSWYVGCYFAAASAVSHSPKDGEKLALFAVDLNEIHNVHGIKHIRVPGSTSVNLSAQTGSFILVENYGSRQELFTPNVSLESKLPPHLRILKKATLPASLAGDLLLRCDKFGISAASIFPGYDGVVKAMQEWTRAHRFNRCRVEALVHQKGQSIAGLPP